MKCGVWRVQCEVWGVKSAVWSVKCGVWRKQREVRSVKCGLWSVKCEVWSVKCEVWIGESAVWSEKCGVWSVKCAVWSVKSAVRSVKGEVELQMWHVKQDTTFAECTHARAWLAHGACKFYRWERSYIYLLRQLPPRLVRVLLVLYCVVFYIYIISYCIVLYWYYFMLYHIISFSLYYRRDMVLYSIKIYYMFFVTERLFDGIRSEDEDWRQEHCRSKLQALTLEDRIWCNVCEALLRWVGNEWHTEVFWFNRTRTSNLRPMQYARPHLQVQKGKFLNCPNFTGLIGSLLHSVNTDHGWSGTLLLFCKGGKYQVCGLHIAGAVDGVPANVAVSAYSLNALLSKVDAGTTEDMLNCPFGSRNVGPRNSLGWRPCVRPNCEPSQRERNEVWS